MQLREWIAEHREELDACINRVQNFVPRQASCDCPKSGTDHTHADDRKLNDEERRQWVLNDEGLYLWARRDGCKI